MAMRHAVMLGVLAALAWLLPVAGIAQGQHPLVGQAAEVRPPVGPFVEIWAGDDKHNMEPAVAYNSRHDEYLAVWRTGQDAFTDDVWARRVRGDGDLKSWFNVASGPGEKRTEPVVAYSPVHDEYLVVYRYDAGTGDLDIRARLVKWDGSWKGPDEIVVAGGQARQAWPAVAYNSQDDEYLVVYGVYWADGHHTVYAQRVDGDGTLLAARAIDDDAAELRGSPAVAYNATRNEYLIVYDRWPRTPPYERDVVGKIASASLDSLSPVEIPIGVGPRSQWTAAVAAGPDEYLVVFQDGVLANYHFDIFARRLSGAGVPQGPASGFPIAQFSGSSSTRPKVSYGSGLGYVVVWTARSSTYLDDIWANHVPAGRDQVATSPYGLLGGMGTNESLPVVAAGAMGRYLMVCTGDWHWTHLGDPEVRGLFLSPYESYLPAVLAEHR